MFAFSRDIYEIIHNVVGLKITEIFCENVVVLKLSLLKNQPKFAIHFILFLMPNLFN